MGEESNREYFNSEVVVFDCRLVYISPYWNALEDRCIIPLTEKHGFPETQENSDLFKVMTEKWSRHKQFGT